MSSESDEIELTAATTCTSRSDDHNTRSSNVPLVEVNHPESVSMAEVSPLGDSREPLSPAVEGSITPMAMIASTEEKHLNTDVTSSMVLPTGDIGVRLRSLLKEMNMFKARLKDRTEAVETAVEPLRRYDGAAVDGGSIEAISSRSTSMQPAVESHMTPELKQSIKDTAELIRTLNGDLDRLGEKLSEWIPLVDKKGELTQDLYAILVTEQEERVKELKEQLHNVQQQLNHKNMEMEHVYEEHKKKINELSEELSRKKEIEGLRKDIEQLDRKVKEHEKAELGFHHEIDEKNGKIKRLSTLLQERQETIAQLERDLNKTEFSRNEMDDRMQELEEERDKLEATQSELIEQLKKHEMKRSDQMLGVIQKSSGESISLLEVLLVRADDHCTLSGVELDGQPTCAFVVCRNDYHRIKQLLDEEGISNLCYYVGNCKLEDISYMQPGPAAKVHGVTDHLELKKEWTEDDSEIGRSKILERNNNEEEETGLWSVVASISGRTDDTGSIMVKVKEIKEAYQQKQQLQSELMQLNSTINEYNKMLAEKQQTIEDLRGVCVQTSGHLQTEQGQVSQVIGGMFDLLNRKLPDAVPMTENTKPVSNIQPQWTEERVPKVAKPWPSASSQYSKSDSRPQENNNFNKVREEKPLTTVTNNLKTVSTFSMVAMKLESASAGSSENSTKVKEATVKPPKKVDPEDESLPARKIEAPSKSVETTAKNSSSSSSNGSTDTIKSSTKKSVLTSTDDEGKDTKKLLDSGDKIHDIKSSSEQQARSDVPKKKPNDTLSKPNDEGTPV